MKLSYLIFLAALANSALVGLTGCKPNEGTINGQVFIVTKGAENIKLGDVDIFLIEKKDVLEFLQKKQDALKDGLEAGRQALAVARKEVADSQASLHSFLVNKPFTTSADYIRISAERNQVLQDLDTSCKRHEAIRSQNEQLRAAARATLPKRTSEYVYMDFKANSIVDLRWNMSPVQNVQPPAYESAPFKAWREFLKSVLSEMRILAGKIQSQERLRDKLMAQLDQIARRSEAEERAKISNAELNLKDAERKTAEFPVIFKSTLFDGFPLVHAHEAHTDADGKFSLAFPQNKTFVLFARAQRKLLDKTETYIWLVNSPSDVKSPYIMSNSKLIDVDPDGYLKFIRQF